QTRRQHEREIAADPIHARHHQAGDHAGAAESGAEGEAPDGAGQIGRQPRFTKLVAAAADGRLHPVVPRIEERPRHPPGDEITARWHLPVEPGPAVAAPRLTALGPGAGHHSESGHRNASRSASVNGFITLPARRSKVALRPPTVKVTVNRSLNPPLTISDRSSSRNKAQGPSNVTLDGCPATDGENETRS